MEYLTIDQVATRLGVHRNTIERVIQAGQLRVFRVGTRVRISERALQEYIESRSSKPAVAR